MGSSVRTFTEDWRIGDILCRQGSMVRVDSIWPSSTSVHSWKLACNKVSFLFLTGAQRRILWNDAS